MDRATLLAAMDAMAAEPPRLVKIDGFGEVHVRDITIGELDDQIGDTEGGKDKRRFARGACRILCDPQGIPLLDPDNPDDVDKMMRVKIRVLTAINNASQLEDAAKKT
jgi:hypothetical protein